MIQKFSASVAIRTKIFEVQRETEKEETILKFLRKNEQTLCRPLEGRGANFLYVRFERLN